MAERPEVTFKDALCNDELVELRWLHRRRLRLISDDFVRGVDESFEASTSAGTETFDPRLAEIQLRRVAGDMETPLLMRLWGLEKAVAFRSLTNLFRERGRPTPVLEALYREADAHQDDEALVSLVTEDSDEIQRLRTYVAILLVADELAGDYRDPRLVR